MNFIKETDPFLRELDAWKKGHGWSNRESLQRLADIWDEFKNIPERKLEIYGSLNSILPKTDLGCGSCIKDMLTFVYNWRRKLEHEVTVYFQGVPQAMVVETVSEQYEKLYNEQIAMNVNHPAKANQLPNIEPDPEPEKSIHEVKEQKFIYDPKPNVKMHQVRAVAKKKGVKYTPKTTRAELIKLINDRA